MSEKDIVIIRWLVVKEKEEEEWVAGYQGVLNARTIIDFHQ